MCECANVRVRELGRELVWLETVVLGGRIAHGEVRECANAKVCELGRGTERAESKTSESSVTLCER